MDKRRFNIEQYQLNGEGDTGTARRADQALQPGGPMGGGRESAVSARPSNETGYILMLTSSVQVLQAISVYVAALRSDDNKRWCGPLYGAGMSG